MLSAKLISKRRVTIPTDVCQRLGIRAGDRVEFVEVERGEFILRPVFDDIRSLKGLLKRPKKVVRIKDMAVMLKRRDTAA